MGSNAQQEQYSNPLAQRSRRAIEGTGASNRVKPKQELDEVGPKSALGKLLVKLTCGINLMEREKRGHVGKVSTRPRSPTIGVPGASIAEASLALSGISSSLSTEFHFFSTRTTSYSCIRLPFDVIFRSGRSHALS